MIHGHLWPGAAGWSLASALLLVGMWFAMMSAMMAPVAWPWVVAFRRFDLPARSRTRGLETAGFIGGYGAAWLLYSVVAATLQVTLTIAAGIDEAHKLPPVLSAAALAGAGLVQFSSFKRACLTHCRNPFSYLLSRWRNGPLPAWRIGFGHGLFCVGCCWALMATTLVVGMANLWWMVALTFAAFVEQASRHGEMARVAVGLLLIAAGVATLL